MGITTPGGFTSSPQHLSTLYLLGEVYPEVAEMAGGPDAVGMRAANRVAAGEPVEALHLVDIALAVHPGNTMALKVRLQALRVLLERSGYENFYEVGWLQHQIQETKRLLGE